MTGLIVPPGLARRHLIKSGALLAASATLGGRRAFAEKRKRIGVGQPDRTADFYKGFITAVHQEADKLGYDILESFSGPAPEAQMGELNAWIAGGVDALVVMPSDPNAIGGVVARCKAKGIVFIGYANIVPGADGYMKWDDPTAGTSMGELIVKHIKEKLGGKAEVALLTLPTNQATRDRIGFSKAAIQKALPDTVFWETQAVLAPEALKATQSLLQAHPNVKVVVCCADDGALGARAAYQNSGLSPDNVFICGWDGSKQNLNLIKQKDKFIQASGALDITFVGQTVVDIPDHVFKHSGPTEVLIPYVMVTPETDTATIDRLLKVYEV
jgi:ABC-type sugar transport system substrate-binding protein